MKIVGCLRVKNEGRWIADVLRSIQPACGTIYVLDDHSTDGTPEICEQAGAIVHRSEFIGLDEARDKQFLLDMIAPENPDVVLAIDGDELLTPDSIPAILAAAECTNVSHCSFRILYLWDGVDRVRMDGVYRNFRRSSMFRFRGQRNLRFESTSHGGNLHCKSIPAGLDGAGVEIGAVLLHLGYLHREDRLRKFQWYRENDQNSVFEDGYRHIVQGDIPEVPASARLLHAGPLELCQL